MQTEGHCSPSTSTLITASPTMASPLPDGPSKDIERKGGQGRGRAEGGGEGEEGEGNAVLVFQGQRQMDLF